ncbi:MAG TPA: hypothetical protein DF383_11110, partial [Deltaproteobacteria bacterium]|nr:hypothetical protein [Deltaproteobacteria bacterium]
MGGTKRGAEAHFSHTHPLSIPIPQNHVSQGLFRRVSDFFRSEIVPALLQPVKLGRGLVEGINNFFSKISSPPRFLSTEAHSILVFAGTVEANNLSHAGIRVENASYHSSEIREKVNQIPCQIPQFHERLFEALNSHPLLSNENKLLIAMAIN